MATLSILVIGGGFAGMSAAIQLRGIGAHVDLVELDPSWRVYGAGITLSGPTLRAFERVGIIDSLMTEGWCADGLDLLTPGGHPIAKIPTPRLGRADVPGGGGIMRPVLARILRERTLATGVSVRCGTTFSSLKDTGDGVDVTFEDGRAARYDLVIGADGLQSKVRQTVFPEAPRPTYTGQVSWRAVVPRPPEILNALMMLGPHVKAGINPISKTEMYLFVTQKSAMPEHLSEDELPGRLRDILQPFGGMVGTIRDGLGEHSRIVYRPFYKILLPEPWFKGRVLIIGDAAHATTPHLASGAGIGIEDAVVLAEELAVHRPLEDSLKSFMARRYERCRMVVENSQRLGDLENAGDEAGHAKLTRESMGALMAKI